MRCWCACQFTFLFVRGRTMSICWCFIFAVISNLKLQTLRYKLSFNLYNSNTNCIYVTHLLTMCWRFFQGKAHICRYCKLISSPFSKLYNTLCPRWRLNANLAHYLCGAFEKCFWGFWPWQRKMPPFLRRQNNDDVNWNLTTRGNIITNSPHICVAVGFREFVSWNTAWNCETVLEL